MREAQEFMVEDDDGALVMVVLASDFDAQAAELAEARELLHAAAHYATKMEPMSAKLLNSIDAWLEKNRP